MQRADGSHATRPEPCAFFFVIFGLIYDALSNTASPTSTSRQHVITAALQSLKFIIKPEFSGNAFQDPAIFDEFMSLCYRMVMTEPAYVQIHLIEITALLATSQSSPSGYDFPLDILIYWMNDNLPSCSGGQDNLANRAQMHCLRICAYVLRHSISRGHDKAISKTSMSFRRINS